MASKWLKNKDKLFSNFKEERKKIKEKNGFYNSSEIQWKNLVKGTVDKAAIYGCRFLIDKNDEDIYITYSFHMFKNSKDKWVYTVCPKHHDPTTFCPICEVNKKLYAGTQQDKITAKKYYAKSKHCGNVYVTKDPRDSSAESEEDKNEGKVKVYEFPDAVEKKIDNTLTDKVNGVGQAAFDPGEDGYDFILKIGATKPAGEGPTKGVSFPEYAGCEFARNSTALGTDSEIQIIMDSRHDLQKHLKSNTKSDAQLRKIIEDEMLFDLVEEFYPDESGIDSAKVADSLNDSNPFKDDEPKEKKVKEEPKTEEKEKVEADFDDTIDEAALEAELDDLMKGL